MASEHLKTFFKKLKKEFTKEEKEKRKKYWEDHSHGGVKNFKKFWKSLLKEFKKKRKINK